MDDFNLKWFILGLITQQVIDCIKYIRGLAHEKEIAKGANQ